MRRGCSSTGGRLEITTHPIKDCSVGIDRTRWWGRGTKASALTEHPQGESCSTAAAAHPGFVRLIVQSRQRLRNDPLGSLSIETRDRGRREVDPPGSSGSKGERLNLPLLARALSHEQTKAPCTGSRDGFCRRRRMVFVSLSQWNRSRSGRGPCPSVSLVES
jgi:hypothetical protein